MLIQYLIIIVKMIDILKAWHQVFYMSTGHSETWDLELNKAAIYVLYVL